MAQLAVERYKTRLQVYEDLFDRVELFVMTLDCFLQIRSGNSSPSRLFEPYEFVAAFLDEAHNVELAAAYCAALCVGTLVILGDNAQAIEQLRYGKQLAEAVDDVDDMFQLGESNYWGREIPRVVGATRQTCVLFECDVALWCRQLSFSTQYRA